VKAGSSAPVVDTAPFASLGPRDAVKRERSAFSCTSPNLFRYLSATTGEPYEIAHLPASVIGRNLSRSRRSARSSCPAQKLGAARGSVDTVPHPCHKQRLMVFTEGWRRSLLVDGDQGFACQCRSGARAMHFRKIEVVGSSPIVSTM
jgi:hypothetical protein